MVNYARVAQVCIAGNRCRRSRDARLFRDGRNSVFERITKANAKTYTSRLAPAILYLVFQMLFVVQLYIQQPLESILNPLPVTGYEKHSESFDLNPVNKAYM